jgi:hypothetical protein
MSREERLLNTEREFSQLEKKAEELDKNEGWAGQFKLNIF